MLLIMISIFSGPFAKRGANIGKISFQKTIKLKFFAFVKQQALIH